MLLTLITHVKQSFVLVAGHRDSISIPGSLLWRIPTGWCVNEIPSSVPKGTIVTASIPLPRTILNGFHVNNSNADVYNFWFLDKITE